MNGAGRMPNMQSLPPVRTHFSDASTEPCNNERAFDTGIHATPNRGSSNELIATSDSLPKPPQPERLDSQPSFRKARLCVTPSLTPEPVHTGLVSVQDVNDSIVKEVPNALVSHVHGRTRPETSNVMPIGSSLDFGKAFRSSSPSFIILDSFEQSANLTIEMLRDRAGKYDEAVIVVLIQQAETVDCRTIVKKVPDFVDGGADDVVVIPVGATKIDLLIAASLAKAKASRFQKMIFKKRIQASKEQCQGLFWEAVHDILPGFPELQPFFDERRGTQVGRKLGEGSYGSVYKWEGEMRNTRIAVKVFAKSRVSSINGAIQIATEFALLGRLKHQNVVTFFGAAHGMQYVYLFMELAGTRNLLRVICAEGAQGLPWSRAGAFFSQIAAGVAHCHKMRVAHCDLKPENIVTSESGCVKIVDFGQAVDLAEDVGPLQGPLGTMPFVAPEIMCPCPHWEPPAADVWSMAVTVVEMLCGIYAFTRLLGWMSLGRELRNPSRMAERISELKIFFAKDEANSNGMALRAISSLCREVPPPFVLELLGKMFELVPEDRIRADSAAECIDNMSI